MRDTEILKASIQPSAFSFQLLQKPGEHAFHLADLVREFLIILHTVTGQKQNFWAER